MSVLVGPVTHLGAPFGNPRAESVVEQEVAGRLCYVFGEGFLSISEDVFIEPAEPLEAIVLWDPSWLRGGPPIGRIIRLRERYPDTVVVGVMSDWFAGWYGGEAAKRVGTRRALDVLDAVVIDSYGAAAIRGYGYRGEIRVLDHFLTYSRLPTVSRTPLPHLGQPRPIDVAFIGHAHPGFVWQRPLLLETLRAAADQRGWNVVIRDDINSARMEGVLLQTKIVVNSQLGTQRNMRSYEAAACGCALVTDEPAVPGALTYQTPSEAVSEVERLLADPAARELLAGTVHRWVQDHTPERTWRRIFDTALS